jgi:hypothetical protein
MKHDQHFVINSHFHTLKSAIEHITFFVSFLFGVMFMNSTLFLLLTRIVYLNLCGGEKNGMNVMRMKT